MIYSLRTGSVNNPGYTYERARTCPRVVGDTPRFARSLVNRLSRRLTSRPITGGVIFVSNLLTAVTEEKQNSKSTPFTLGHTQWDECEEYTARPIGRRCTLLQFRLKCGQNLQNRLLWNNFGATFSHVELIRASFATWRIHITQPRRLLHVFELGTLRWSSGGSVEQQYHVCIDLMFAGWS